MYKTHAYYLNKARKYFIACFAYQHNRNGRLHPVYNIKINY